MRPWTIVTLTKEQLKVLKPKACATILQKLWVVYDYSDPKTTRELMEIFHKMFTIKDCESLAKILSDSLLSGNSTKESLERLKEINEEKYCLVLGEMRALEKL